MELNESIMAYRGEDGQPMKFFKWEFEKLLHRFLYENHKDEFSELYEPDLFWGRRIKEALALFEEMKGEHPKYLFHRNNGHCFACAKAGGRLDGGWCCDHNRDCRRRGHPYDFFEECREFDPGPDKPNGETDKD